MNKYNFLSLVLLLIYLVMFALLGSGFAFWSFGIFVIIVMVLIPLLGIVFAIKGSGLFKWLLLIFNIAAIGSMVYILFLAFGIGEA